MRRRFAGTAMLTAWGCATFMAALPCYAYDPPRGVPNPAASFAAFGEIDQPTPEWTTEWTADPPAEVANSYYVDKTEPGCSDARPYGFPGEARCTPPEDTLTAGAFVYIHAGVYTAADSSGQNLNWNGVGTDTNPIWIVGNAATKPIIQDQIGIGWGADTSYLIVENLDLQGAEASFSLRPLADDTHIDHIIIRDCTITGTADAGDSGGISVGVSSSSDEAPNSTVSHVVVYRNEISNKGDQTATEQCGIYNSYHTDHVWALDNTVYGVGADSIAGCHYCDGQSLTASHYFIGRNTLYGNGENGIDLKGIEHIIISENTIYGPFTREQGWGIVLHAGPSGHDCQDAYVLGNTLYHLSGGIYANGDSTDLFLVDNVIYDISDAYAAQPDPLNGSCFNGYGDGAWWVVDNTCHDYERGASFLKQTLSSPDDVQIHGNIFATRKETGSSPFEIDVEDGQAGDYLTIEHNLFHDPTKPSSFYIDGGERDYAYLTDTLGQCGGATPSCIDGSDPAFVDTAADDYRIQSGSPAEDASVEHAVYARFEDAYGLDIRRDHGGVPRPQGGAWDIGAHEYTEGGTGGSGGQGGGAQGGAGAAAGAGGDDTPPAPVTGADSDDGCGCATPGQSHRPWAWAALGLLTAVASRHRRRRRSGS